MGEGEGGGAAGPQSHTLSHLSPPSRPSPARGEGEGSLYKIYVPVLRDAVSRPGPGPARPGISCSPTIRWGASCSCGAGPAAARTHQAYGASLRQCSWVFPPRTDADSGASARSIRTAHALYGPWRRVTGALPGRRERRSRLYLHPSVVGRDDGRGHSPLELLEKHAALVPLPHVHLVRYGGCLAPHSHLRGAILPTPRQQGLDEPEACPTAPRWSWAQLLQRVFVLDMARCHWCQQGMLRLIAVITQGEVIRKILHHLKLSVDPPTIAPARSRQAPYDWVA